MSKLEQLIAEFCPNGVEYVSLGEIAIEMYRGAGIKREQVTETGIPCVRYGEIYTTYNIWFDTCKSHTDEDTAANKKYFGCGDVLFAITGESVEEIAKSCVYIGNDRCLAGGDIVVMKHGQNPKYLAHVLSTTDAQAKKSKGKVKSKVVHSSVPALKAIKIPLPPLAVQSEMSVFWTISRSLQRNLRREKLSTNIIAMSC
jgi:type I restriction enzyme S subunit